MELEPFQLQVKDLPESTALPVDVIRHEARRLLDILERARRKPTPPKDVNSGSDYWISVRTDPDGCPIDGTLKMYRTFKGRRTSTLQVMVDMGGKGTPPP